MVAHTSKTRMAPRRWSHAELAQAIAEHLANYDEALPPPSIPTIKTWAKQGLIDTSADLQIQAASCAKHMHERRHYYKRKVTRKVVEVPAGAPQLERTPHVVDQLLKQFALLEQHLSQLITDRLSNIGKSSAHLLTPVRDESERDRSELLQAISQLDAVRAHVMRRYDAEIMLLRQQSGQTGHPLQGGAGSLDMMRLEGRLNRVETNQASLMEMLSSLSERIGR